jgi:hypothetical protein
MVDSAHTISSVPVRPAMPQKTRLDHELPNMRTRRAQRLADGDPFWRDVSRLRDSAATFAQAISSTNPTAPFSAERRCEVADA